MTSKDPNGDNDNNNSNNNDEPQFQFTNVKQRQSLMESTMTENRRYSKRQQQQQQDINDEDIPEALPSPHNDYCEEQLNDRSKGSLHHKIKKFDIR